MTAPTPEIVAEIQKRVNLVGVRLVRGDFQFHEAPAVVPAEWELDLNARLGGRKAPAGNGFIQVIAGLDVVARSPSAGDPKKPPHATIKCDFGLDYQIADISFYATLKDADVLRFGARNGMYNAWPYMRAHVQLIASAMMLPLVLPTFRPDVTFPELSRVVEEAARRSA